MSLPLKRAWAEVRRAAREARSPSVWVVVRGALVPNRVLPRRRREARHHPAVAPTRRVPVSHARTQSLGAFAANRGLRVEIIARLPAAIAIRRIRAVLPVQVATLRPVEADQPEAMAT